MVEILKNKNLATRFQILVEVADKGPNIKQQDIARKLEITPQAVSDYIGQLSEAGLLASDGRSRYKVTVDGVDWIIKVLRELREYDAFISKAITNISVSTAVADVDVAKEQTVGLKMEDGLLLATEYGGEGARGVAIGDAKKGNDVGVANIEGIIDLRIGRVTVLRVPGIRQGGSAKVNLNLLKREAKGRPVIGAIGLEALTAIRQAGIPFYHVYGAKQATLEAANSGLDPLVVCVADEIPDLVTRLEEEKISYDLIDIGRD